MKISLEIKEIMNKVEALLEEIETLRLEAEMLEKKNEQLSQYIQKEEKDESVGTLIKLHEQGFHICNEFFGRLKDGDCLFCLNLIDRAGKEK